MFDKLKKHGLKIFVFAINIFLAGIAVFVIRERDETRLLENAPKEALPSFENGLNGDSFKKESAQEEVSSETTAVEEPVPAVESIPAPTSPIPATAAPVPAPVQKTKPANAKTKTS